MKHPSVHLFTGPECAGKSTAALWLSRQHGWPYKAEYARSYLHDTNYTYVDVAYIAGRERMWLDMASINGVGVLDTGPLVTHIWMLERFGRSTMTDDQVRRDLLRVHHIWLCKPDMSWEADPLREGERDREHLFSRYQTWLDRYGVPHIVLEGTVEQRQSMLTRA